MAKMTMEIQYPNFNNQLPVGINKELSLSLLTWMLSDVEEIITTEEGEEDSVFYEIDRFFGESISPEQSYYIHEDSDGHGVTEEVYTDLYLLANYLISELVDALKTVGINGNARICNSEFLEGGSCVFTIEQPNI